jgi:hypothetical protein
MTTPASDNEGTLAASNGVSVFPFLSGFLVFFT